MTNHILARLLLLAAVVVGCSNSAFAATAYHHVHLNAPVPEEGVRWYVTHMGCSAFPARADIADCGTALVLFFKKEPTGPSEGTGVNHIGFSFTNIDTKVQSLQTAGVRITMPVRDIPGLFKIAFVEDPWGTRIELVQHSGFAGFHHVHLSSAQPDKTLTWYKDVFGGERTKMAGAIDAVLYGKVWLLVAQGKEAIAPSEARAVDHLGFALTRIDVEEMKGKGVTFTRELRELGPTAIAAKVAFVTGPDGVLIEIVEPRADAGR